MPKSQYIVPPAYASPYTKPMFRASTAFFSLSSQRNAVTEMSEKAHSPNGGKALAPNAAAATASSASLREIPTRNASMNAHKHLEMCIHHRNCPHCRCTERMCKSFLSRRLNAIQELLAAQKKLFAHHRRRCVNRIIEPVSRQHFHFIAL